MTWFDFAHEHLAAWKSRESAWRATFTPSAWQAMESARAAAVQLRHGYIGAEHLLLGLLTLDSSFAVSLLRKSGMDYQVVFTELTPRMPDVQTPSSPEIPYTLRCKRILQAASNGAKVLNHAQVEPDHLVLALLKERDGPPAPLFLKYRVEAEAVRCSVLAEFARRNRISDQGGV